MHVSSFDSEAALLLLNMYSVSDERRQTLADLQCAKKKKELFSDKHCMSRRTKPAHIVFIT